MKKNNNLQLRLLLQDVSSRCQYYTLTVIVYFLNELSVMKDELTFLMGPRDYHAQAYQVISR